MPRKFTIISTVPAVELGVACAFFAAAIVAVLVTDFAGGVALIWPANALAAALLIRLPKVRWYAAATTLMAAALAINVLVAHFPWPLSVVFPLINGLEIAMMVWAFRFVVRYDYPKITLEQASIMAVVLGIVIPGVTAVIGALVVHSRSTFELSDAIPRIWEAHALGACLTGPPIILWSNSAMRRLIRGRFLVQNFMTLLVVLVGCWASIRYVRFPFVCIGVLLLIAAFRVGGFGASLLGTCTGFMIGALWGVGVRPEGLESTRIAATLAGLPIIPLLATVMPPIAVGLGSDARRAAVKKLHASESRFRESLESSPIGMLIADMSGIWNYTNHALQTMLGYTADEFRAMPPGGPSDPQDFASSAARLNALLQRETNAYSIERRFKHRDGRWVWTHVVVSLVRDEAGNAQYWTAQIESREARRNAEEKLAEERERLRITLMSIDEAVITTDAQTRISFANASAEAMLGLSMQALQGRLVNEIIHLMDPDTSKPAASLTAQCAVHGTAFHRPAACILHRADGSFTFVVDTVSPVIDASGCLNGMVIVLRDATGEIRRARDLNHRATHDPLTDLANRFKFHERLTELFTQSIHLDEPAALLAIDLDLFKGVNDSGGHAAGDAVLRGVAGVLRATVRESDVIARLGGDEFAVILPRCAHKNGVAVAQKILQALNPLHIEWQGARHTVGASIGLAMLERGMASQTQWLAAADKACYRAKEDGRGLLRGVSELAPMLSQVAGVGRG